MGLTYVQGLDFTGRDFQQFKGKDMHQVNTRGFTFVELIIIVAIVGLLLALAYPSFRDSVVKGRRADAIQSLQDLRLNQSRWRSNHTSYATTLTAVGFDGGASTEGYYTIVFVGTPNATSFLATATPAGQQVGDACGTYAINHDGPVTSGSYASNRCWNQ